MYHVYMAIIFSCCFFSGKAQHSSRAAFDSATASHKLIAILPAEVTWDLRKGEQKKVNEQQVTDAEIKMGFMVQSYFSQQLIKKAGDYRFRVAIQPAPRSNFLLFANGLSYNEYKKLSTDTVAGILGADAFLISRATVSKTMDEDLANAFRVINLGIFPGNARIKMHLELVDTKSGIILWTKDFLPEDYSAHTIELSLEKIVKKAAKLFPYRD